MFTAKLTKRSLIVGALLSAALACFGQDFRATVTGRITDSSGAVVPGAKITITQTGTSASATTRSTETGDYVIPSLVPGVYRLEVESPGFKRYVREGITLQIQDKPVIDVVLEPGEITTAVTVTSDVMQVETATASRGDVITGRTVVDMPLNGRNAYALAALTPGVLFTARGQASTFLRPTANNGISSIAVSGAAERNTESLLDGVPNTGSDGLIQYVPSVDATQEFKVQTNAFDAEYGRFRGAVINATIRSGTNELHGAAFEFVRNSAFNARDPFATSIPQFGYNQFGFSVGGPVYLPKVYKGRNRTFFFANYEGSREGVPRAFVSTVPTDLQRRGDFSQTSVRVGTTSQRITIYDPATTRLQGAAYIRDPFPANAIPSGRFDPVARNLINLFPAPNAPGDAVTEANNYLRSFKDPVLDNGYVVRIDHRFSDRHAMFGRYSWRHFRVGRQGAFKNEVTGDHEDRNTPGAALDDTITLNPTTVLNLRYGFTRYLTEQASDNLGRDMKALGFPASLISQFDVQAIPSISIAGYTGISTSAKRSVGAEDTHTLRGGVTKVKGRHSFRFGAEGRLFHSNSASIAAAAVGAYSFNSTFTRGPNPQAASVTAGSGLASFFLGATASGTVNYNAAPADSSTYYGAYFQDDVRLTSRLTVNVGLRYEIEGPYVERYNRLNRGYDFSVDSPINAAVKANYARSPIPEVPVSAFNLRGGLLFAGVGGVPRALTELDKDNVAPRLGAAFALTPKTVLRGGIGRFFGATTQYSEVRQGFSNTTTMITSTDGGLTPANVLSNPFPEGIQPPPGASLGLLTFIGQSISYVNPYRKNPTSWQYQFSIQRQIRQNFLFDLAYVGSTSGQVPMGRDLNFVPKPIYDAARQTYIASGRNVLNDVFPNPFRGVVATGPLSSATITRAQLVRAYPHFAGLTAQDESLAKSRYDALQAKLNKRFSNGVSFQTSYAFAKQIDQVGYLNPQDTVLYKRLASFDVPHRFVASGVYELPLGRGRRYLGALRGVRGKLIEGYQLNLIYAAQSGIPLDISGAESLGRSAKLTSGRSVNRWFDTTAFRQRETLEYVGLSRLPDVRSPGKNNWDISIYKNTGITEKLKLQFRAEAFNALNHPEYSSPGTTFGSANFGVITSTNTFARQLQFGLKLLW